MKNSLLKNSIKSLLSNLGFELRRKSGLPNTQLFKALKLFQIDTVLDVGANEGQFGKDLRGTGYKGRIISFEPLSSAHQLLLKNTQSDKNWLVHDRAALGDVDGDATINIAGNSVSSSIMAMTTAHETAAEGSAYVSSETIEVQQLDSIADRYLSPNNRTFLKIDTQGFESQVLDGAKNTLKNIQGVLLETSLLELYKGQMLWQDMIQRMEAEGFTVWAVERGFTDPANGQTLQCDIIFFRYDSVLQRQVC